MSTKKVPRIPVSIVRIPIRIPTDLRDRVQRHRIRIQTLCVTAIEDACDQVEAEEAEKSHEDTRMSFFEALTKKEESF